MTSTIKLKETKLLVDYGVVAAVVENVIAVVIDSGTMNEDPDEKTNENSNLMKTDERGCSTEDANTRVQSHVFVSYMQMND